MLDLLLIVVFGLHLLAVDVAMAGPLLAIWLQWRESRFQDRVAGEVGRRLAGWSLAIGAAGMGLGLLSVVLLPVGESSPYRTAFGRIPAARWWYVVAELAFYIVVMWAYVGLWRRLTRTRTGRVVHRGLAVMASTNLLYHFPPLFVVISALSLRPELWHVEFDRRLYWQLLLENESLARVAHHWLASVAVTGGAAMLLASRKGAYRGNSGDDGQSAARIVRASARLSLIATVLQLPVGCWVLIAAHPLMQEAMLGENGLTTGLFVASIIASLGLMHHLAVASLGDVSRRAVVRTAGIMALVVLLMVATLHRARQPALEEIKRAEPRPAGSVAFLSLTAHCKVPMNHVAHSDGMYFIATHYRRSLSEHRARGGAWPAKTTRS